MKTIYWLLFSHLKVYFEISKIKISHFPYECMLRDLSALCGFRFQKNLKSFPIQVLSHPWSSAHCQIRVRFVPGIL